MKNLSESIEALKEKTDIFSYFVLGHLYEMGNLLPRNLEKASEFYSKAASVKISS